MSVRWRLLIWGAIGLGVFFRGYHVERKIYWYDEVFTSLWIAGQTRADLLTLQSREYGVEELQAFARRQPGRGVSETLTVLAANDPQHPPLYYLLARLWVEPFGDSIGAIRRLSVVLGILVLPLVYLFTLDLTGDRASAGLATALVSLSPFHVLYAQEARQYGLWTAVTVLSSLALWRASVSRRPRDWWLYALTVALGVYTHALFVVVILAHGVHVLASTGSIRRFAAATGAGLVLFAPWAWVVMEHRSEAVSRAAAWAGRQQVTPWHLAAMWSRNVSVLFFDTGFTLYSIERVSPGVIATYAVQVGSLAVVAYALYRVWRARSAPASALLLALVFVPLITLGLNDLLTGGIRSGMARYVIPSLLGTQIAVAVVLGRELYATDNRRRRLGAATVSALLLAGLVSCLVSAQAETWWTKNLEFRTPKIVGVVNRERHPLLLVHDPAMAISFSQKLDPRVRVWIAGSADSVPATGRASAVFAYRPSPEYVAALRRKGYEVRTELEPGLLFRVQRSP